MKTTKDYVQTEWNSNLAAAMRFDDLQQRFHGFGMAGDHKMMYRCLKHMQSEVIGRARKVRAKDLITNMEVKERACDKMNIMTMNDASKMVYNSLLLDWYEEIKYSANELGMEWTDKEQVRNAAEIV